MPRPLDRSYLARIVPLVQERIKRLCARWGLNAVEIGRVTGDGRLRVKDGPQVVADIPALGMEWHRDDYGNRFGMHIPVKVTP